MAGFGVNMPDFLEKYVFSDSELEEMIDSTTGIAQEEIKASLSSHSATGSMVNSVKASKAKKTKNGDYIAVVSPSGKDKNGVRNIEKAVYLNYGTIHEPAKPWLAQALNNAEGRIQEKLSEEFNERLKKK